MMDKNSASQWVIAFFSTVGAFFLCGMGGAFIADIAGFWEVPTAGFCAAFSVVSVAYVSAPKFNNQIAIGTFVLGAIVAWFLLVPSYFPGNYDKSSYAPILATILGGVIALAICLIPLGRPSSDQS